MKELEKVNLQLIVFFLLCLLNDHSVTDLQMAYKPLR